MKKLWKTVLLLAVLISVAAGAGSITVKAEDKKDDAAEVTSGVMTLKEDVGAREEADASSKEVITLKKGASIFVMEKTENGWYHFVQDGTEAYVECSKVNTPQVNEALAAEMEEQVVAAVKDIDMVNQYREEASKSKIWGAVIVLFVIAIFAVGIITTVRKQKTLKEDKESSDR